MPMGDGVNEREPVYRQQYAPEGVEPYHFFIAISFQKQSPTAPYADEHEEKHKGPNNPVQ